MQDLGVCQTKYSADTVLPLRLERAVQIARQVGIVGLEMKHRVQQLRAVFYAGGLYGMEIAAATQQFIQALRKAVAGALWQGKGPRNRAAAFNQPNMDPWAHMCVHILTHWWRMAARGYFEEEEIRSYWEDCKKKKGRPRGPIHQTVLL